MQLSPGLECGSRGKKLSAVAALAILAMEKLLDQMIVGVTVGVICFLMVPLLN